MNTILIKVSKSWEQLSIEVRNSLSIVEEYGSKIIIEIQEFSKEFILSLHS